MKINFIFKDDVKKTKDLSYGTDGISPSQQRKIDRRVLNIKSIVIALILDFCIIAPTIWAVFVNGLTPANDKSPYITHQKYLMTEDQWITEKEKLIILGNDKNCEYFK